MNITGEAINSLSKQSRIPPCPGNIFPESFTPAVRLSKDSHKSPQVENMEVKIPIPIHWAVESIPGMMLVCQRSEYDTECQASEKSFP